MTDALFLWLYGSIVLSSVIMASTWGNVAVAFAREPDGPLLWSKRFVVAASLTLHAVAMAVACFYRAADMWTRSAPAGSMPLTLAGFLFLLLLSKIGLVWAGSIHDEEPPVRWPWWAYLYLMLLWGLFCGVWKP